MKCSFSVRFMNATSWLNLVVKVKLIIVALKDQISALAFCDALLSYTNYVFISSFSHTVQRVPKDLSCPSATCLASRGSYAANELCCGHIVSLTIAECANQWCQGWRGPQRRGLVYCTPQSVLLLAFFISCVVFLHAAAIFLCVFSFPHNVCLCVDLQNPAQRPLCTKSDEVRLAEEASKKYGSSAPTIFSKVIAKSIPADIIYEDDKVHFKPIDASEIRIYHGCIKWYKSERFSLVFCSLTIRVLIYVCLSVLGIQGHQSTGTRSFPGYSKSPYSQNQ